MQTQTHNREGNCWDEAFECSECGGHLCDVCHEHDQPRGDCDMCPPCGMCEQAHAQDVIGGVVLPPMPSPDDTAETPAYDPKALMNVLREEES